MCQVLAYDRDFRESEWTNAELCRVAEFLPVVTRVTEWCTSLQCSSCFPLASTCLFVFVNSCTQTSFNFNRMASVIEPRARCGRKMRIWPSFVRWWCESHKVMVMEQFQKTITNGWKLFKYPSSACILAMLLPPMHLILNRSSITSAGCSATWTTSQRS